MKHIEGISRDQIMMTDLESLIPANSECRVIDIFCDKLDMVNSISGLSELSDTKFQVQLSLSKLSSISLSSISRPEQ